MNRRRWLLIAAISAAVVAIPAAGADFPIRLVSQTSTTITLGWDRQANVAAYTFYRDGKRVSHTFDGDRVAVTFAKVAGCVTACYGVEDLISGGIDRYPGPPVQPGGQLFVSTTGNDSNPCTQAAPCQTFNRAYQVAKLGDVVTVTAGTYPQQTIRQEPSKDTTGDLPDVVFQPAAGATVRVAGLSLGTGCYQAGPSCYTGPDHLTIRNMSDSRSPQGPWQMQHETNDATFENIDASNWYLVGVRDVKVLGGDWGPCSYGVQGCLNNKVDMDPGYRNERVMIDGGLYHDIRINTQGQHMECMFLVGGIDITVRNAKFTACEFFDIFVQYYGDLNFPRLNYNPFDGLVLESNDFDRPYNGTGQLRNTNVWFSDGWAYGFRNVTIRGNIARQGLIEPCGDGMGTNPCINGNRATGSGNVTVIFQNFVYTGNTTGEGGTCYDGVIYSNNVKVGGWPICGPGDRAG